MAFIEEPLVLLERTAKLPKVDGFLITLKTCRKCKDLARVKRMLVTLQESGLETHGELGNYLVPTLVECGSTSIAERVFERLEYQNVYSWTALVQGHNDCGEFLHALGVLQRMRESLVSPSCYTFQGLLQSSTKLKSVVRGHEIHSEIIKAGYNENGILSTTLVDMYAKCGSINEARMVFDRLPCRNLVAWNTLIMGYAECGLGKHGLECFGTMQVEGMQPDAATLVGSLKSCCMIIESINTGRDMHNLIINHGLEENIVVSNTLVDMYVKLGSIEEARDVFDKMRGRDVVSWNILLAGYVESAQDEETLRCLQKMQLEGICASHVTVMYLLNSCRSIGAIDRGFKLHTNIIKRGIELDLSLGTSLVEMYANLGFFCEAEDVFDKVPNQSVITWTALITGYAEHGFNDEALERFELLQRHGLSPDAILFSSTLRSCNLTGAIDKGLKIHSDVVTESLESDEILGGALVDFYLNCGFFLEAQDVYNELPYPNASAWCALTAGFTKYGSSEEILVRIDEMLTNYELFSAAVAICSLQACGSIAAIDLGLEIHTVIVKRGLEGDSSVGFALFSMYGKCCSFMEAQDLFNNEQCSDVSWWNELITCCSQHHCHENVLKCMEKMKLEGIPVNDVGCICGLKAYTSSKSIDRGLKLHSEIVKAGLENQHFVSNTLVDMYGKFGFLEDAWHIFSNQPIHDIVTWNAMMAGYTEHGHFDDVFGCLDSMGHDGISPNPISFLYCIKACSSIGALDRGLWLHSEITKRGFEHNTFIGSSLVDMYARSGSPPEAWKVFNQFPHRNVVVWTSLMAGYTDCGEKGSIFDLVERMKEEGIKPNKATFLNVLTVCSHAGLVDEALDCFHVLLSKDFCRYVSVEHLNTMVDLLGRAGQLNYAAMMWDNMPFQPDLVTMHSVMSASRKWSGLEFGKQAFECAIGLCDTEPGTFILMYNIYADPESLGE